MTHRLITILLALLAAGAIEAQKPDLQQQLKGLAGDDLALRARQLCMPENPSIILQLPGWLGGAAPMAIVADQWWYESPVTDNYNILGASPEFIVERGQLIATQLDTVTARGEGWRIGETTIAKTRISAWMPDDDRRGDLARRVMYMGMMYPQRLWRGNGVMMFDSEWPYLSTHTRRVMLDWHRADPVDQAELKDCSVIEHDQGNVNPFVAIPSLCEYLWGDKAGQPFVPEVDRTRSPLKSHYSIGKDGRLDFYSPYVPDGAQWAIDGKAYTDDSADLTQLATGIHTVSFTHGSKKGKMKFILEP